MERHVRHVEHTMIEKIEKIEGVHTCRERACLIVHL